MDEFSPECDCPRRAGGACIPHALEQYAAEVERLEAMERRVQRLLDACDGNEAHVRANVPHLPPDGGSFSVHVIRRYLRAEA